MKQTVYRLPGYTGLPENMQMQGNIMKPLDSFLVSLELRKRFYGEKNNILAGTYMAVGTNYKNIGKYDLALKIYLNCRKLIYKQIWEK